MSNETLRPSAAKEDLAVDDTTRSRRILALGFLSA